MTARKGNAMSEQVLAAVRTGPGRTELREFPRPDIPDDGALLRVEVAGICGTDVKMYAKPPFADPVIMGHENIGVIDQAGPAFTERHGSARATGCSSSTTSAV
jgi:threonine dehydrogenase-like Zn-dependent dehydrogenase